MFHGCVTITGFIPYISGLVIFIQKILRGVLARRLAKRMRAAYKIGLFYRRVKYLKLIRVLESSYK